MSVTKRRLFTDETGKQIVAVLQAGLLKSGLEITDPYQIQNYVRTGQAEQFFPVGTQFVGYCADPSASRGTLYKYLIDVVAHNQHFNYDASGNATATYSMTCQFHGLLGTGGLQFDSAEDEYGVTIDSTPVSWKYYYTDSSGGGQIQGSAIGSSFPSGTTYYERNDNATYPRKTYGSNNWRTSGLRQWLNADPTTSAGSWWSKQTACDKAPSYQSYLPFQALFFDDANGTNQHWLDIIKPARVKSVLNTCKRADATAYYLDASYGEYGRGSADYSSTRLAYDVTEDRFYLPNTREMHCSWQTEAVEGTSLEFYEKFADVASYQALYQVDTNRIKKYRNGSAGGWWLRSANTYASDPGLAVFVGSSGFVGSYGAYTSYGVAPLFTIY